MQSNISQVVNTLRNIDDYETLLAAVETLESVVYNFENPECSCDYLRAAACREVADYTKGASKLADALRLMLE